VGFFEDAHVTVLLADYIGVDAGGKVNAIGAGFTITGIQPHGLTAPQHVVVLIDVPGKYAGREFAFSLELRDEDSGSVVQVAAPSGQPDTMRIQQILKGERSQAPDVYLPESMFLRIQVAMAFVNGLPLAPGRFYSWRAQVDGQHRRDWSARFHVLGPPPPPVFGGPAGPADIPNIPAP
jgi:hypothetical protein